MKAAFFTAFALVGLLLASCSGGPAPQTRSAAEPTVPVSEHAAAYPYPSPGPPNTPPANEPANSAYPPPVKSPASSAPAPGTPKPVATAAAATPQFAADYTCPLEGTNLPVYTVEIVRAFPHDPNAYTQGLIVRDGVFYESTGLRGRSSLRRVEINTGEVLMQRSLPEAYFGEGLVELGGKLYQLTWQEQTGFIFDLETFEPLGEFHYPTEGWGLTTDGERLLFSDGSDKVYFLDPATLQITDEVQVRDDRGPVMRINEMEFIEGEVWANLYRTACIARFDPIDGHVTGWIDLTGLHERAVAAAAAGIAPEVLNGIAYDTASQRLFVTGKLWPEIYEIILIPAEQP